MPSRDPPELPKLPPDPGVGRAGAAARAGAKPVERPDPATTPPEPEARRTACTPERAGAPPRRRRRGRGRRTAGRLSTAGHALVVAVLALLFGALLLAPGMHKAAFNGQPGTKRDVALALTGGPRPRQPRAPPRPAARARPGRDGPGGRRRDRRRDRRRPRRPRSRAPSTAADDPAAKTGRERPEAAREARVHAEEEAAALGRRRLARDHARVLDRPGGRRRAP